ncbi:3-hydroxypropanoate dehydrogenase [Crenobacter luteus]|uniref:Putative NADH dehydrogenase/NAD(P)H nitroreductase AVW16_02405 n=1 Tax=Crenobacter luteus TaxID=1452487 RepID=A0A165EM09_9NEIS|nr:malonic semialdehyde reductase [Crenobacter luteus]KZE25897.1 nitroreductase family protein [Crenobacter luteus]TCP14546.1 3-hydroxypropanoate dehydrogenase [Crenobacter luteus]
MTTPIQHADLEQLFHNARTFTHWQARPVAEATLRQLFDLLKLCPTSANCSPARFVFVASPEAKARLKPCLAPGNVDKTMSAPVTAIVAMDTRFYEHLPQLFPHADAKSWFEGNAALIDATAFRNSSLQGGYLILAARALGLDCGPMSGFDADQLNAEFFPDGRFKANFLVNIGYGDASTLHPRSPRFGFDEACRIL